MKIDYIPGKQYCVNCRYWKQINCMPEADVINRYQCACVNADDRVDHNHANKCDFFKGNLEYKKDWTAEYEPCGKNNFS